MNYIERSISKDIASRLFSGKAIIIYGPRQSGKTTMLKKLVIPYGSDTLWLNADSPDVRQALDGVTVNKWRSIIGSKKLVIIDEAQRVNDIGMAIKLLTDELPEIQLVATGSSSFDLANKTSEPLTGRKCEYRLFPILFSELCHHHGLLEEKRNLHRRLIFGQYPEIVNSPGDEACRLSSLAGSYLYKDLLMLEQIKKPSVLDKLLNALALQLGSEVSFNELSKLIGIDNKTLTKYVDLLEKAYVVFSLPAFSRNARVEIRKSRKIYFYDLGIRNAILGNFSPIESRTDTGALWENFLIVERLKINANVPFPPRRFFWRNTEQREVDYLEESVEGLAAWEFKWNQNSKTRIPRAFKIAYPEAETSIISSENYDDFLAPDYLAETKVLK